MLTLLAALACQNATEAPSYGLQQASVSLIPGAGVDPIEAMIADIHFQEPALGEVVVVRGGPADDPAVAETLAEEIARVEAQYAPEVEEEIVYEEVERPRTEARFEQQKAPTRAPTEAPELEAPKVATITADFDPGKVIDLDSSQRTELQETFDLPALMRRNKGRFGFCHDTARTRYSGVSGRIEVAWTIEGGTAHDIEVIGNDTGDDILAACVVRQISTMRFAPDTEQDVVYPFVFPKG